MPKQAITYYAYVNKTSSFNNYMILLYNINIIDDFVCVYHAWEKYKIKVVNVDKNINREEVLYGEY